MKKIILLFLFSIFSSVLSYSQLTLKKLDGTIINDGSILNYNTVIEPDSYLGLKIYNSSTSDIRVRIKCVSISGADGTNLQLCINPICVGTIVQGNYYPSTGLGYLLVPANGQNGNFDHFVNYNSGNGVTPVEYVFKVYMVNGLGNEIGNSVTFTYKYESNLAIDDFTQLENSGIVLNSSLIQSQLDIRATKNNTMQLFDLNGKLIKTATLSIGEHAIDTSNLISGMYILKFRNEEEGQESSIKIMKN